MTHSPEHTPEVEQMTETAPELKPCPFCGDKGKPVFHRGRGVKCQRCKAWGPDPERPFADWNRRADLHPQRYPYTHHGKAVHGSKLEDYLITIEMMKEDGLIPEERPAPMVPAVKPLEWECTDWSAGDGVKGESDCEWQAQPHLGETNHPYEIRWIESDVFEVASPFGKTFDRPSLEAAKAAAQTDYERRILSALEPAPMTKKEAARVLLADDIAISEMAQAMHDGPLMADEYAFSAATKAGGWCVDMARAALRALAQEDG